MSRLVSQDCVLCAIEKYFHLEESTGLLLLHAPLDREAQATYTLDVQVGGCNTCLPVAVL